MADIITFFGGDSQVGTTLLSGSVCQGLKQRGKKSVLILASSEIGEGYFTSEKKNNLGNLLRLSSLGSETVANCIASGPDFDIILGSDEPLKKQFFEPDLLEDICEILSKNYDFIVIDGGHDITLPLCVASLTAARRRYYVLTGSEKCRIRFEASFSSVIEGLGLDTKEDRIVLNKDSKKAAGYSAADLQNLFGKTCFAVPMYQNPERCESDHQSAYSKDSAYQRAVLTIADDILGETGKKKK